jgi:hypothetical protein
MPQISQAGLVTGALLAGFVLFLAANDRLRTYLAIVGV